MNFAEAELRGPEQESLTLKHRTSLFLLIAAYFFTVLVWVSPEGRFKDRMLRYLRPVAQATGIAQSWELFCPEPREINFHETAIINFQDGTAKIYEFPRMQKMDYVERFRHEKLRKMFYDCMPWPSFAQFLPDFAKFIARANANPNNEPVLITFVHHTRPMPAPDPTHWVKRDDLPEHIIQTPYFIYKVQPEDLHETR
jgi:hypothetical protein